MTIVSQNVSSVVLDWNDITYIPYSVSFFVYSIFVVPDVGPEARVIWLRSKVRGILQRLELRQAKLLKKWGVKVLPKDIQARFFTRHQG